MAINETADFESARDRLDEIVNEVRSKDLSLEKSLDLYEEAIKLGTTCSNLVDKAALSNDERVALANVLADQNVDGAVEEQLAEEQAAEEQTAEDEDYPVSEFDATSEIEAVSEVDVTTELEAISLVDDPAEPALGDD